jgi:hypothetical protein
MMYIVPCGSHPKQHPTPAAPRHPTLQNIGPFLGSLDDVFKKITTRGAVAAWSRDPNLEFSPHPRRERHDTRHDRAPKEVVVPTGIAEASIGCNRAGFHPGHKPSPQIVPKGPAGTLVRVVRSRLRGELIDQVLILHTSS